MCMAAIVDTSDLDKVLVSKKHGGDSTFHSWIRSRHGELVYASTGDYCKEIQKNRKVMKLIHSYRQGGHLKLVDDADLSSSEKQLQGVRILSNDPHVLALALASDALVLCSADIKLCKDFKNKSVLPKIGQQARAIYPTKATKIQRKKFLGKRKCLKQN